MSGGYRGGERRQHAPQSVCTRRKHERSSHAFGDASFARPFDPCTSILTMHPTEQSVVWWGVRAASRLGKLTQVGGTSTGAERADGARLVACHRFRKGEARHVREGRRSRPPSLRGHESSGLVARTSIVMLQKSVGDVWSQISSAHALQKGRSGSSERGPSSGRTLAGDTVSGCFERNDESRVGLTVKAGKDRHEAQGGERSSSSGRTIAKSGEAVSGPRL